MFGASVAASGDTVVVGAPGNGDHDLSGAVYVFTKPASGWESTSDAAKLTPETGKLWDRFGINVAVEGEKVVIGGKTYDGYRGSSNDAYVFTRPEGGWISTSAASIKVFVYPYGYFYGQGGVSVGVSGDDIFVGTPSESGIGVVYAYEDFFDG